MAQSCRVSRCNDCAGYSAYFCRVDRSRDLPPNIDLHHLIKCDAVLAPIVELRSAR